MRIFKRMVSLLFLLFFFGGAGFIAGFYTKSYFYPGESNSIDKESALHIDLPQISSVPDEFNKSEVISEDALAYGLSLATGALEETLCVDTKYLIQEIDLRSGEVEEMATKLPIQYVGMNREQFMESMSTYQTSPPLSEVERGFKQLEVHSFSREQVVVKMYYEFIQPTHCYYIAAYDNRVVVYLEDKKTVYIDTGIPLDSLPEEIRTKVINMYCVEDESILFGFLENYTS